MLDFINHCILRYPLVQSEEKLVQNNEYFTALRYNNLHQLIQNSKAANAKQILQYYFNLLQNYQFITHAYELHSENYQLLSFCQYYIYNDFSNIKQKELCIIMRQKYIDNNKLLLAKLPIDKQQYMQNILKILYEYTFK